MVNTQIVFVATARWPWEWQLWQRNKFECSSKLINNFVNQNTWPSLQCSPVPRRARADYSPSFPFNVQVSPPLETQHAATGGGNRWKYSYALHKQAAANWKISFWGWSSTSCGTQNGLGLKWNVLHNENAELKGGLKESIHKLNEICFRKTKIAAARSRWDLWAMLLCPDSDDMRRISYHHQPAWEYCGILTQRTFVRVRH